MSQNEGKVIYLNSLPGFKQCNKPENPTYAGPLLSNLSELKRMNYRHHFGVLEVEVESRARVYDEIKVIAKETGYSLEKIVDSAL